MPLEVGTISTNPEKAEFEEWTVAMPLEVGTIST